jgi:hypothetical protein
MQNSEDFRAELKAQIDRAINQGRKHIEINAGELHRAVGGYPPLSGKNHSMPSCCGVLRDELSKGNSEIVYATESGNSASLTVRFNLPR